MRNVVRVIRVTIRFSCETKSKNDVRISRTYRSENDLSKHKCIAFPRQESTPFHSLDLNGDTPLPKEAFFRRYFRPTEIYNRVGDVKLGALRKVGVALTRKIGVVDILFHPFASACLSTSQQHKFSPFSARNKKLSECYEAFL